MFKVMHEKRVKFSYIVAINILEKMLFILPNTDMSHNEILVSSIMKKAILPVEYILY